MKKELFQVQDKQQRKEEQLRRIGRILKSFMKRTTDWN